MVIVLTLFAISALVFLAATIFGVVMLLRVRAQQKSRPSDEPR